MLPNMSRGQAVVKRKMGSVGSRESGYGYLDMGNGLRAARIKAGMSLDQAADAFALTKSGYTKKERNERGLTSDFIRKACEIFGVSPEDIMGTPGRYISQDSIDPIKLEDAGASG